MKLRPNLPFPALRLLRLAAALLLPAAVAAAAGSVAGRVTDGSSRLALAGARVTVEGTALVAFADAAGEYALADVPAGQRRLLFSYVGYAEVPRDVAVEDGRATRLDVAFGGDVVALEKFVITGSTVGSARALNQQRAADTLTSIIASDESDVSPTRTSRRRCSAFPDSRSTATRAKGVSSWFAGSGRT